MNESPSLWHWLINRNVDGVVTNYPATGFKYKLAKSGTQKYSINRNGIYFGQSKTPIMMNPYVRIKQKKYVYPNQHLHVMYGVRNGDNLYYQIANKTFISAEFVNFDLKPSDIAPYRHKSILVSPFKKAALYRVPDNQAKTQNYLPRQHYYQILNFNGSPKNLWLYTKLGWVKAKNILFAGFVGKDTFADYHRLPKVSQYDNLLLFTCPVLNNNLQIRNYYQLLKLTQKICK